MRFVFAISACLSLTATSAAFADSRVFFVANQADGYGIDQCLAKGDSCGAPAARAYCQSHQFSEASAFRKVDPDEITGSMPKSGTGCAVAGCGEYIAITCQR
jgi:hypothetical protein